MCWSPAQRLLAGSAPHSDPPGVGSKNTLVPAHHTRIGAFVDCVGNDAQLCLTQGQIARVGELQGLLVLVPAAGGGSCIPTMPRAQDIPTKVPQAAPSPSRHACPVLVTHYTLPFLCRILCPQWKVMFLPSLTSLVFILVGGVVVATVGNGNSTQRMAKCHVSASPPSNQAQDGERPESKRLPPNPI